jgi:hypothetical protein
MPAPIPAAAEIQVKRVQREPLTIGQLYGIAAD